MNLASYVCTYWMWVNSRNICLIDLQAYYECLANSLDWSWYMRRLDLIYLFTFHFLSKSSSNIQSLEGERVEKALLWKLVRLGKGGPKMYSKYMMPKPKAYSSKKYKKFHGIDAQKLRCIDQKVWKMEAKWKAFNQCKHFGEESYTLISISNIGHLTSCFLCMTWLNWSLKIYARLWTNSYLILTHNTQV